MNSSLRSRYAAGLASRVLDFHGGEPRQNDFHQVAGVLHGPPQRSDHIAQATHLPTPRGALIPHDDVKQASEQNKPKRRTATAGDDVVSSMIE